MRSWICLPTTPRPPASGSLTRAWGAEAVSLLAGRLYHNDTGPVDRQMMLQISGQWKNGATAPPK
ncbi:MAG: hypothetical protein LBK99_06190 [Opitutaceae bacterium]|nr:hypothetical protein [Opitutaceae bacterium]